jgi:hypothetical protein
MSASFSRMAATTFLLGAIALVGVGLASAGSPGQSRICEADDEAWVTSCICNNEPCAITFQVTPSSFNDCEGCSYTWNYGTDCSGATCQNESGGGTNYLSCNNHLNVNINCPGTGLLWVTLTFSCAECP